MLLWLSIIAKRGMSVDAIVREHWNTYGRNYYTRHDFEEVDAKAAGELIADLRATAAEAGKRLGCRIDDFAYDDPVDKSVTKNQGIRLIFPNGDRIVYRLSGTGTAGATLRVYIESFEADPEKQDRDVQTVLGSLIALSRSEAGIEKRLGRVAPDVVT